jgi:hypothetical protein
MTTIEIRHRWNDALIYTHEAGGATMRDAVLAWLSPFGQVVAYILGGCRILDNGCIEWGMSTTKGRGKISIDGRKAYVHRAMWEQVNGSIPDGMIACHSCDNPLCVSPAHIFIGTHLDNMRDMVKKGRSTKGRKLSLDHRLKVGAAMRGKTHSPEVKARIAASVAAHRTAMRDAFAPTPA